MSKEKKKVEIIKIDDSRECYICKGNDTSCRACKGTGIFKEYHYQFIFDGMCFQSDNLA